MRQYPMSLSPGVKVVTGLVILFLCATPVVVWTLAGGMAIGGPVRRRTARLVAADPGRSGGGRRRQRHPDQLTHVLRAVDTVRPGHPARLAPLVAGCELA